MAINADSNSDVMLLASDIYSVSDCNAVKADSWGISIRNVIAVLLALFSNTAQRKREYSAVGNAVIVSSRLFSAFKSGTLLS